MKLKELLAKRREKCNRMSQIATTAAAENEGKGREFTPEEKDELEVLSREVDNMNIMIKATQADLPEVKTLQREIDIETRIREAVTKGEKLQHVLAREVQNLATAQDTLVPLTINDVVPPLEKGLIYDKVGIKVQTGLAGDYVWPLMGSIEAEVAGESVELSDQTIDFTAVKPNPRRVGISITVSMQTVTQTRGVILDLIRQQMPMAISRTLNRVLFSHEKFTGELYGPFKDAEGDAFAGAVPTYKELLEMKGEVMGAGIIGGTFCYVMSEAMKATLEATPRDAGSGLMICENDKIAGYPVFCTEYINYGAGKQVGGTDKYSGKNADKASGGEYIGAGVWLYQVLGQFGDFRFTVDPYTKAKSDEVVFTLNSDWSSTTLRSEAFVLKKTTAGA